MMICKSRKTTRKRNYHAPEAKVAYVVVLERNFCQSDVIEIEAEVDELEHFYHHEDSFENTEQWYFEF